MEKEDRRKKKESIQGNILKEGTPTVMNKQKTILYKVPQVLDEKAPKWRCD